MKTAESPPPLPTTLRPAPGIADLVPYRVPRHPGPIDLHLDSNEGATPPRWELADALQEIRRYPQPADLETALAQRWQVEAGRVLVTAGGDDALARAVTAMGASGRNAILPVPTFEMLGRYLRQTGIEVRPVPWNTSTYPLDAVCSHIDADTALIFVVSPNNPTGAVATSAQLQALSQTAPHALLVVDTAYGEYADNDIAATALKLPNAVVIRTFSKAWGLAGLRVGYAIGPTRVIDWMRSLGQPYAVSRPSLWIAKRALESRLDWVETHIERVQEERNRLYALLEKLGQAPRPSQANFVLVDVEDPEWLTAGLAGFGIAVRQFKGNPDPSLARCVRIGCPANDDDFDRLRHALYTIFAPTAVIFDGAQTDTETLAWWASTAAEPGRKCGVWCPTQDFVAPPGVQILGGDLDAARCDLTPGPAWYLTQRAETVAMAREAGLLPLAIAPGEDMFASQALLRAGAAWVLPTPDALEEVLP